MKYARFYIEKRKTEKEDKHKEWPVVVWFNYNGKSFHRTIGVKTTEQNWDSKKQRLKPNVPRAAELNRYIDLLEEKLDKIYSQALADGRPIDNQYIIEQLKNPEKKSEPEKKKLSFFEEWEKYLELKAVCLQHGTIKSAKSTYNHFKKFCTENGLTKITFDEFTDKVKADFAEYLYEVGECDNTVHIIQKRMNTFLNYTMKIGIHSNQTHKAFTIPERTGTIKFLEWDEVKRLIDVEVEPGIESDCRDLFVFGCLTALRFSDAQNLKKLDIKEHKFKDLEGIHYALHIRQQKTSKAIVIPLLPEALYILNRYKYEKTEFALPQRANQSVNRIIKQIARRAKLKEPVELVRYRKGICAPSQVEKWRIISTHMGRRTFATIAITRGIPINVVASITGQNPATTMKHYMGVIDSKKFEELASKIVSSPVFRAN
jgi:integrase